MSKKDKPAEAAANDENALRTKHFLEIERSHGDAPGAKEMAMTKKPRTSEKEGDRTRNFVEIEKGRKA